VLLALMERGVTAMIENVRRAVAGTKDPIERLRLGLREHLKLLLSGEDTVYVLLFEWRSLEGAARAAMVRERDRYEGFWDGLLGEALREGKGRRHIDVKLLRLFGFGAVNWVATWYRPGGGLTPEQIADAFFTVLAFGLISEKARPSDVEKIFAALFKPRKRGSR
jgi:TetR/AcrR family transcriptional regulator, cholesterol catabolism regulator